jgi:hypothetical protein
MFKLQPAQDDTKLFFGTRKENTEQNGKIGYVRIDFGRNGDEFYSTWFDNQPNLKVDSFKTEFDDIISFLRENGENPPFANRKELKKYFSSTNGQDLGERGKGYIIRTNGFSYYFRCRPSQFDYDVYCFCYDNRFLLPLLEIIAI